MLQINFSPFPLLQTKRLLLRQIFDEDANEIFTLRSSETVMKYLDRPMAKSIDDALELIKKINTSIDNNEGITWAICLKNEKKLIGTIGFWRIEKENYRAEIGYMLNPSLQGMGIINMKNKKLEEKLNSQALRSHSTFIVCELLHSMRYNSIQLFIL